MTLFPHDSHGRYELERMLGRGAMGIVYAARDRRIGRRVALKTIELAPNRFSDETSADQFFKRLQREAEVCGSLLHPNIVTLYEAGYDDSGRISFLAMELVEGDTLLSLIKRQRPEALPLEQALRIAEDVLRGLAHAHAKGIIHRDIKPANILLTDGGTAKLADFGIARPQDSDLTGSDTLLGTPSYMAPEQVLGERLTTQADVFSLGVVLYEMLSATKPFAGDQIAIILNHIVRTDVPNVARVNPAVPKSVGDFVERLMAKANETRPTAVQALAELSALLDPSGRAMPARHALSAAALSKPMLMDSVPSRPRRPLYVAIIATVAVLAVGLGAGWTKAWLESGPSITISETRRAEFAAKRQAIDAAKAAYDARQFEDSRRQYDEYLQKYPDSVPAQEGRKHALAALQQEKEAGRKKATRPARGTPHEGTSLLSRLKKVFRH
ncbi:MAG: serine/threonine-protein kinase [Acidobacteriota bacterium]